MDRAGSSEGWALDLDGVVWLADRPIERSAEAVALLRQAGHRVVFVTNNSYSSPADVAAKLTRHGIEADESDVLTSASAVSGLVEPGETVLACAGPGVTAALGARGCTVVREGDADAVVVGYDPSFDYAAMTAASVAVRRGARLVATNSDATYPTPQGPIPGAGSILASIATATGVEPLCAGKPHEPMATLVRELLGPHGVMVGDRLETDGRFARVLGYRYALVLSGVTGAQDAPFDPEPDVVAEDLWHAVEMLG